MTYSELLMIAEYLRSCSYRKIHAIERVEDTIIKIAFDHDSPLFFDMRRGDSAIFAAPAYQKVRRYQAPFDVVLSRRFHNARIEKIEVPEGNRILRIQTLSGSAYKAHRSVLQLEFTGRNTNAIILDEEERVLEALRHVDLGRSYREVRPGVKLLALKPHPIEAGEAPEAENMRSYLEEVWRTREARRLAQLKLQKRGIVQKKLKRLERLLEGLEPEERLSKRSERYRQEANLVLSHLHTMRPYQRVLEAMEYDTGTKVRIELPPEARTPAEAANMLFRRAKKLAQKARHTHIERENLEAKIAFLKRLDALIEAASSVDELQLFLPRQPKQQKRRHKEEGNIETFFCEGYKISVGKNEKGNIALLKSAKMSDIWMHLKDLPSTHVIIRSDRRKIPEAVIRFGAKLCVGFSQVSAGSYLVDYTPRRNVKMKQGAHVEYVEYQTVTAEKP